MLDMTEIALGMTTEANALADLSISRTNPESKEVLRLSDLMWAEENSLYGDIDRDEFLNVDFTGPRAAFVLASIKETVVGCGAIRQLHPGIAEVRRIFVTPETRNRGVAGEILSFLEGLARDFGYQSLRLETGLRQPAAIRVYEKAGYARIPAYGIYENNPLSVCFEKAIRRLPTGRDASPRRP